MALDKKEIALSVVGVLAGLALTYLLWMRSQESQAATAANAAAQAAATAAAQEQESQQFDSASSGLSNAGSGGGVIYEDSSPSSSSTGTTSDGSGDIGSIISALIGGGSGSPSSVPGNGLIPEVQVSDGSTSLSGIATSATEILGEAPPSTISTTTSTGQTYGATSSNTPGTDANPPAPVGAHAYAPGGIMSQSSAQI